MRGVLIATPWNRAAVVSLLLAIATGLGTFAWRYELELRRERQREAERMRERELVRKILRGMREHPGSFDCPHRCGPPEHRDPSLDVRRAIIEDRRLLLEAKNPVD
jgi:hypothetical protein